MDGVMESQRVLASLTDIVASSTRHYPRSGLTEQILHSFTIDIVPSRSLVFLNVVMDMFSGARSLPPFPLIMRNDSLESVSL